MSYNRREDKMSNMIFNLHSSGVKTNRDAWMFNFCKKNLTKNMKSMIEFYCKQVDVYSSKCKNKSIDALPEIDKIIDNDETKISWTRELKNDLSRLIKLAFQPKLITSGMYRPFCKQAYYFDRKFNNCIYQIHKIFPNDTAHNLVICVTGVGASKEFSALLLNTIPEYATLSNGLCFPMFSYEKCDHSGGLFREDTSDNHMKRENIPDSILKNFKASYDAKIKKEDIFYYVYGILHSSEYKRRFEADLKKMLPRIPMAKDFWVFSKAGRELAKWHLNYETIEPHPLKEASSTLGFDPKTHYKVAKMTFGKRGKDIDKTTIIYNSNVTLTGIPLDAYDYVVNGKPALEWIMERYQFTRDKDSQITNDPNDWSDDPKYIIDLVKRVVRVSMETMKIVNSLPALDERK